MKQVILTLIMVFSLSANASGVKPRHRHHPQVELADSVRHDSMEAYSDTTSTTLAGDEDSTYTASAMGHDIDDVSGPDKFVKELLTGTLGFGTVVIIIFAMLIGLIFVLAPLIILFLVIRYFINRHNSRVALIEKAMETGRPIPEEVKPMVNETPENYRKRGIKNIAIGAGLFFMFAIWGSGGLMGVGALIVCLGIGQVVISKTSK